MRTRLCLWWSKEALVRDFPVPDDLIATLTSDQVDDLVTKYGVSESDVIIYGAPWEHTPDDDNDSPPQTQDATTQTETDIADAIETLLNDGSEQSLVTACVALYKHKRSYREDDTEWLEEAVRTAKKQRGC